MNCPVCGKETHRAYCSIECCKKAGFCPTKVTVAGQFFSPPIELPRNPQRVEEEFITRELEAHTLWEEFSISNDLKAQAAWENKQRCIICGKSYLVHFTYIANHRMRHAEYCNVCDYGIPDEDYSQAYRKGYINHQETMKRHYVATYMWVALHEQESI